MEEAELVVDIVQWLNFTGASHSQIQDMWSTMGIKCKWILGLDLGLGANVAARHWTCSIGLPYDIFHIQTIPAQHRHDHLPQFLPRGVFEVNKVKKDFLDLWVLSCWQIKESDTDWKHLLVGMGICDFIGYDAVECGFV